MPDDVSIADDLLWNAAAISEEIYGDRSAASVRKTFYLLERDLIPAKKLGRHWISWRSRLRESLGGKAA